MISRVMTLASVNDRPTSLESPVCWCQSRQGEFKVVTSGNNGRVKVYPVCVNGLIIKYCRQKVTLDGVNRLLTQHALVNGFRCHKMEDLFDPVAVRSWLCSDSDDDFEKILGYGCRSVSSGLVRGRSVSDDGNLKESFVNLWWSGDDDARQ